MKTARRRFMVPIPRVHDLSVLNERPMARCLERLDVLEAGERATATPCAICRPFPSRPASTCRAKSCPRPWCANRLVDYSAPAVHAHKKVMVKGYVDRIEIVARHRRSHIRGDVIHDPLHYLSLL